MNSQEQASSTKPDILKRNQFYALHSRGDQEISPNDVTGMLQVFSINVYALLSPSATLCFVTPLVSMKLYILPNVLHELFLISTSVGDSIVVKKSL